ncbi:87_t:CDS:1, partial [Cetraspora pellucida]
KNGATYRIMRRYREPLKDSTESSKIESSNASALKNLEVDYGAVCM